MVLVDSDGADDFWTSTNVRLGSHGLLSGPNGLLTAAEKKLLSSVSSLTPSSEYQQDRQKRNHDGDGGDVSSFHS